LVIAHAELISHTIEANGETPALGRDITDAKSRVSSRTSNKHSEATYQSLTERGKFEYTGIAALMARLVAAGVKRVRVIAVNDPLTCDPCREMDGFVLPVEAVMPYVTSCESAAGCRCEFEPLVDEV
jgi:hypothetical protein